MRSLLKSFALPVVLILLNGFFIASCKSRESKHDAAVNSRQIIVNQAAIIAQQKQIIDALAGPTIFVIGDVRHSRIQWNEDLTLAQALLAAEFLPADNPQLIRLSRGSESMDFEVQRWDDDFFLESGDVIEIFR